MKKTFLLVSALLFSAALHAATFEVGIISANRSNDQWQFTVDNYTGPNALAPDFLVTTPLDLSGTLTLACNPDCSSLPSNLLSFGPITPGTSGAVIGNFSTAIPFVFNQFTFNGNFAPSAFVSEGVNYVSNGNLFVVPGESGAFFNESGSLAGYSWVLGVEGSVDNAEIPEPTAMVLVGGGLLLTGWWRKHHLLS